MNDHKLEQKVRKDAAQVRDDLGTLAEDSADRLSSLGNNVGRSADKAKKDLTKSVEDGVSQLSKGFEKLSGDAKETVVSTAATVKKDVGHRLNQYNAMAKDMADKAPDGFGKTVARYPWVAISIGLALGFLLGMLLRPARQPVG